MASPPVPMSPEWRVGTPLRPSYKLGNFGVWAEKVPQGTRGHTATKNSTSTTYTSKELFDSEVKTHVEAEASYNGGLASGSMDASLDLLMKKSTMKDTVHYTVLSQVLSDADTPDPSEFKFSQKALDMKSKEDFWKAYGVMFVYGIQYGSKMAATFSATYQDETDEQSIKTSLTAAAKGVSVDGSVNATYESNMKTVTDKAQTVGQAAFSGVDPDFSTRVDTLADLIKLQYAFETWSATYAKNANSDSTDDPGAAVYATLMYFHDLPDWPFLGETWESPVPAEQLLDFYQEASAVRNLQDTIAAKQAFLQADGIGQLVTAEQAYYAPLSKQTSLKAIDKSGLSGDIQSAITNFESLNLFALPLTDEQAPGTWTGDQFTYKSLSTYYKSGRKQALQWDSYFQSASLTVQWVDLTKDCGGGLLMSKWFGYTGQDTYTDCYVDMAKLEAQDGIFCPLSHMYWAGYYWAYQVTAKWALPGGSEYTAPQLGNFVGCPGGGAWEPHDTYFTQTPTNDHVTSIDIHSGLTPEFANGPCILTLRFNTDNGKNGITCGTGDGDSGLWETASAPQGYCLHGWLGWCNSSGGGSIRAFQPIWIKMDWIGQTADAIASSKYPPKA